MIRRQPKTIQKSPKKKHLEFREDPVDLVAQDEERRRRFEQLKEQFRPSMVRLLHSELEKLGIGLNQVIEKMSPRKNELGRQECTSLV